MRRYFILMVVGILLGNSTAHAGELLFSLDYTFSGSAAPFSAPEGLQMVMSTDSPSEKLGLGVFWQDGGSGSVELTSANESNFADFVARITDGADELLFLQELNADGGGAGSGNYESGWGFGNPDLAGYDLDLIRLTVHELSIEEYNDPEFGDGLIWDGSITWDFYGEPVPEPSTLTFLTLGIIVFRARRRCNIG